MAVGIVTVTVIDVGQGQCTFIEVWDDTKPNANLLHTVMVDCGSDKTSPDTNANLQYIVNRVSQLAKPTFDCIIFSHSDKDHISLTWDVLQKFTPAKKPVVKKVWYGGDYDQYVKNKFNILNYMQTEGYVKKKDILGPGSFFTNYDPDTNKLDKGKPMWETPDKSVQIFCIVGNVISEDADWDDEDVSLWGSKAEEKNRVSIVCALYFAGKSFTICGDATKVTMSEANALISDTTTIFNSNEMTTLPHHGSRATAYAVPRGKDPSDAAVEIVDSFAKLLKSKTLTASAYEKHRHPSLLLMSAFIPLTKKPFLRDARLTQKNTHRLNVYVDIKIDTTEMVASKTNPLKKIKKIGAALMRDSVWSFDTNTCTFTTRYTNPWLVYSYNLGSKECETSEGVQNNVFGVPYAINPHACWMWDLFASGNIVAGGYANLTYPLTLFTTGPLAEAMQPGTMGRTAIWLVNQDKQKTKPSPTKVRTKTSTSSRQPAPATALQNRLQQFH